MKKLQKSNKKVLFGVCGGIAEYLKVDPTIIRLCVCLITLFKGVGIILYIVAALVMPESSAADNSDVENMKSANIDSEKENNFNAKTEKSEKSSNSENYAPHSEEEFNSFFKK